jgi:hypothetical protein
VRRPEIFFSTTPFLDLVGGPQPQRICHGRTFFFDLAKRQLLAAAFEEVNGACHSSGRGVPYAVG